MRKLIYTSLSIFLFLFLIGCKTKYIPIETIKTEKEYVDKWHRDSIHIHDSIFYAIKGDTIYLEKYKTIYKDREIRDSILVVDSVKVEVPYPVEVPGPEVNRLTSFQSFQIWCGRILLLFLLGFIIYKRFR